MVSSLRGRESHPEETELGQHRKARTCLVGTGGQGSEKGREAKDTGGSEGSCPLTLRTRGQWSGTLEVTEKVISKKMISKGAMGD